MNDVPSPDTAHICRQGASRIRSGAGSNVCQHYCWASWTLVRLGNVVLIAGCIRCGDDNENAIEVDVGNATLKQIVLVLCFGKPPLQTVAGETMRASYGWFGH